MRLRMVAGDRKCEHECFSIWNSPHSGPTTKHSNRNSGNRHGIDLIWKNCLLQGIRHELLHVPTAKKTTAPEEILRILVSVLVPWMSAFTLTTQNANLFNA